MYLEGYGESTESCLQDEILLGQSVQWWDDPAMRKKHRVLENLSLD